MPDGNTPFCGGSGPTWNDAMGLHEILRSQNVEHGAVYGAIAYSPTTGRHGWSFGASYRAHAETAALASCRGSGQAWGGDAQVVCWGLNTFLALAIGDGGDFDYASNDFPQLAGWQALRKCHSRAANCRVAIQVTRTGTLQIRRAVSHDAGEIARLHVRAWQWAYRGLIPENYLDGLTDTLPRREAWRTAALVDSGEEQRTWVADVGDRIVGFADTAPSRDEDAGPEMGELCSIYLDEFVARRGVGTALLYCAMNDLRSREFVGATLWVLDSNHGARSFYEALGWTIDGALKNDPRQEFELHEVRYRVNLAVGRRQEKRLAHAEDSLQRASLSTHATSGGPVAGDKRDLR